VTARHKVAGAEAESNQGLSQAGCESRPTSGGRWCDGRDAMLSHCLLVPPNAPWNACVRSRTTRGTLRGIVIEDVLYTFSTTEGEWQMVEAVGWCPRW
jgi:hypothetical protein